MKNLHQLTGQVHQGIGLDSLRFTKDSVYLSHLDRMTTFTKKIRTNTKARSHKIDSSIILGKGTLTDRNTQISKEDLHFHAPERYLGVIAPSSDYYSVGALLFFLVTGKSPNNLLSFRTLLTKMERGQQEKVLEAKVEFETQVCQEIDKVISNVQARSQTWIAKHSSPQGSDANMLLDLESDLHKLKAFINHLLVPHRTSTRKFDATNFYMMRGEGSGKNIWKSYVKDYIKVKDQRS